MSEPSLPELEAERERLYAQLSEVGDFRRGSVSENYRKCGKPNCACAQPGHPGHGPRFLWTRTVRGQRTRGRQLAAPELGKVRGELAAYQEVRVAGRTDRGSQRGDLRGQAGGRHGRALRHGGRKKGPCDALAGERAAEVGRLSAEAAKALGCGDAGLQAAEAVLRAGLLKLGGGMLGQLLAADPGYRGPRVPCGNGHEAWFIAYRDKIIDTVLGPVTLTRAWYHCAACGHGLAPATRSLARPARPAAPPPRPPSGSGPR
jgi:hypothetical protein